MWIAFAFAKSKSYSHFFSKYTCELDIVLTGTVDILTTYGLVKLKMLWKTWPYCKNKIRTLFGDFWIPKDAKISSRRRWRFWLDCADAQADLSHCWTNMFESAFSQVVPYFCSVKNRPRSYKTFLCSTQLSMIFSLTIDMKIRTPVGISCLLAENFSCSAMCSKKEFAIICNWRFISRTKFTFSWVEHEKVL